MNFLVCYHLNAHLGEAKFPFLQEKVLLNVRNNKLVHKKRCVIDPVWE